MSAWVAASFLILQQAWSQQAEDHSPSPLENGRCADSTANIQGMIERQFKAQAYCETIRSVTVSCDTSAEDINERWLMSGCGNEIAFRYIAQRPTYAGGGVAAYAASISEEDSLQGGGSSASPWEETFQTLSPEQQQAFKDLSLKAYQQQRNGELTEALETYKRSLALSPGYASNMMRAAELQKRIRKINVAAWPYTQAIMVKLADAKTYAERAWVYTTLGDFSRSDADLSRARELSPYHPMILWIRLKVQCAKLWHCLQSMHIPFLATIRKIGH